MDASRLSVRLDLGDLFPAVNYAALLIEKQAAVVQAARALVGTEPGSLPHGIGINDLRHALAELDHEFEPA